MTDRDEPDAAGQRGRLRVYLGASAGVGKTYAMLDEGRRRLGRGVDVVVGLVETHGRAHTAALLDGLEVVPRRELGHRGAEFTEMDLDAVLARAPQVALVDELAHTNVPGSRNAKRCGDIEELLAAGIDVVTTVNIQHLESLNDVVASITGVRQQETIPDEIVRRADQIELVDMSPESLRRRLAHGNVYPAEKIDAAMSNYFRLGNLTALRELALLWTADRVDEALEAYRKDHDIAEPWAARERLVVAVTGGTETETLVRRAARIAQRGSRGEFLAIHVLRSDGLTGVAPGSLGRHRTLVESLGGSWHTVLSDDVPGAVLDFARSVNANQILLGVTRRGRVAGAVAPGVAARVVEGSGEIDVLVVTHERARTGSRRRPPRGLLTRRRTLLAWTMALAGPPLLSWIGTSMGELDSFPTVLMLFLTLTVGVALVGGLRPALLSAVLGGLLSNFLFAPPVRTWTIDEPQHALAIGILLAVAVSVSAVVDLAARRTLEAGRARAEADALTSVAGAVVRARDAVPAVLEQLRETLGARGVALVRTGAGSTRWQILERSSGEPPGAPDQASATVQIDDGLTLGLSGRTLSAGQVRFVGAVGQYLSSLLEREELRSQARAARAESERGAIRTALLAAVSHDLRTPLTSIKAGITALRSSPQITPQDRRILLADVEDETDRLQSLIDNLLDMSRIDAGVVTAHLDPVALDEVVPLAARAVPTSAVEIDVPEDLPLLRADAGLLERALANLIENAVRHTAPGTRVRVVAEHAGPSLMIRVVDRGPGVPDEKKDQMFAAFQRLGDVPRGQGLGLGLAVARGFIEANGGTLEAEDTPGGGLTMIATLPLPAEAP
ncbi:sensor histidine kinase [Occultella gossypii]|uniref:histidine kinase n=1 Tax=Occultella gossypii TaxID=2800820 RepID=A0ABS7S4V6_9MICO|nr:sensor histidine kinase KdpD [Occultella gossypii]MBZ2195359.1 sensor histidine kinase KdpD [Occultella gossypii]